MQNYGGFGYGGFGDTITLPPATIIQNFLDQLTQLSATAGNIDDFDVVVDSNAVQNISIDTADKLVIVGQSQVFTPLQTAVATFGATLSQNQITDTDLQNRVSAAQQSGAIQSQSQSQSRGQRFNNFGTTTLGKVSALRTLLTGLTGQAGTITTQQKLTIGAIGAAVGAGVVGLVWVISALARRVPHGSFSRRSRSHFEDE